LKKYLVGGAVRDQLLGRQVKERDWVIVGSSVEEMIKQGFKPVGKEFPVFLHPETHDEYALARTEKKVGHGYHGFEFYASPEVTLEEDLKRRDLTVNAMAQDEDGTIIDPYNGQDDLKKRVLRHVSEAFAEDPVRILRIARFASRFHDFTIAPETMKLMQEMVGSGEVDALVRERVWQELERALCEDHPERFIEVLRECGALKVIFPEIDALFGIPGSIEWHPEVDTGIHLLMALKRAVELTNDPVIRFAVLVHDVGKSLTEKEKLPKHHGHCEKGVVLVKELCRRLHVPKKYQDLAELVTEHHGNCHKALEHSAKAALKFLERLDAFRRPKRFENFLIACKADTQGRLGFNEHPYLEADFLKNVYEKCAVIDTKEIIEKFKGEEIAKEIHKKRLKVIQNVIGSSL